MQVSIEEVAMLLGQKDIEILVLQKQIKALQERIVEMEKPKDGETSGVHVSTVGQTGGITAANVP